MKKILLTALTTLSLFSVSNIQTDLKVVSAEEITTTDGYSDIITDLEQLKIDYTQYLSSSTNEIITMAQYYNDNGELETYVYVNSSRTEFNELYAYLSTSISSNIDEITEDFQRYEIELVSSHNSSNLKKYKILGLNNLEDTTRRYNIRWLYGTYINEYSGSIYSYFIDNLKEEVYFFNGTNNENLKGLYNGTETITITDKEVVNYCYGDSLNFFGKETGLMDDSDIYNDTWFIFFNTDKVIDNLLEVELVYTQYNFCIGSYGSLNDISTLDMSCIYTESWVNDFINDIPLVYQGSAYDGDFYINYNDPLTKVIEPGTTKVSSVDSNFWSYTKTHYEELDNIMDLREYKKQDDSAFIFTDYADTFTWGVHFNDTTRQWVQKGANATAGLITASGVTDTAILRLKFETSGDIYNLYAVDTPTDSEDNKGEIADTPIDEDIDNLPGLVGTIIDNSTNIFDRLKDEAKEILKYIGMFVGVIVFIWLLSIIIPFISKIIRKSKKKGGR